MHRISSIENRLEKCYKLYVMFAHLIDCYVLDFFTGSHWEMLQLNWQAYFQHMDFPDLGDFLNNKHNNNVRPLSLLALTKVVDSYVLSRKRTNNNYYDDARTFSLTTDEDDIQQYATKRFWKNIKAKKRHEISIMSSICYESAKRTNCFYIVDIGSGVGHLSRMLNYGFKLKVCSIEAQESLTRQARIFDDEFEKMLHKHHRRPDNKNVPTNHNRIVHVNRKIMSDITSENFLSLIKESFGVPDAETNFQFGLVGLHPCGNLGTTLIRLYVECKHIMFINVVGCCYMKLTNDSFPLSKFSKQNHYHLSYMSREIACHAIENYADKLYDRKSSEQLKIHTYRAVLEKIIVKNNPNYTHCGLSNVKLEDNMDFLEYSKRATRKMIGLELTDNDLIDTDILKLLDQWKKVVCFNTIRLLFAPIIETIILTDRVLYVVERVGSGDCTLIPAFDPKISPRNLVLNCHKKQVL